MAIDFRNEVISSKIRMQINERKINVGWRKVTQNGIVD